MNQSNNTPIKYIRIFSYICKKKFFLINCLKCYKMMTKWAEKLNKCYINRKETFKKKI